MESQDQISLTCVVGIAVYVIMWLATYVVAYHKNKPTYAFSEEDWVDRSIAGSIAVALATFWFLTVPFVLLMMFGELATPLVDRLEEKSRAKRD